MTAVCCGYECHFKCRQLRENAAAAAAAVWKLEIQIYANNQIQLYPPCENDAAEQSEWAGEQCATGDDSEILPAKIVPEEGGEEGYIRSLFSSRNGTEPKGRIRARSTQNVMRFCPRVMEGWQREIWPLS